MRFHHETELNQFERLVNSVNWTYSHTHSCAMSTYSRSTTVTLTTNTTKTL